MAPIVKPGKSGRSILRRMPRWAFVITAEEGVRARHASLSGRWAAVRPPAVRRTSRSHPAAALVDAEGHVPFVDARRRMAFAFRCRSRIRPVLRTAPIAARGKAGGALLHVVAVVGVHPTSQGNRASYRMLPAMTLLQTVLCIVVRHAPTQLLA